MGTSMGIHSPNDCYNTIKNGCLGMFPGIGPRNLKGLSSQAKKHHHGAPPTNQRTRKSARSILMFIYFNIRRLRRRQLLKALSLSFDRKNRRLDGLSNEHRRKVVSFCPEIQWKLSAHDRTQVMSSRTTTSFDSLCSLKHKPRKCRRFTTKSRQREKENPLLRVNDSSIYVKQVQFPVSSCQLRVPLLLRRLLQFLRLFLPFLQFLRPLIFRPFN